MSGLNVPSPWHVADVVPINSNPSLQFKVTLNPTSIVAVSGDRVTSPGTTTFVHAAAGKEGLILRNL